MSSPDVPVPGPREVRIATSSGSISVVAESRSDVVAEGGAQVDIGADRTVEVSSPRSSMSITVRCPEGVDLVVGTRSGSLQLRGHLGAVRATTLSGKIQADDVAWADLRGISGSIVIGSCADMCRVKTKSGSIKIGSAGAAEVSIGTGSVEIAHVKGAVRIRAISGSVQVAADGDGPIEAEAGPHGRIGDASM
jgi:DUF4097 and DUF4098 domain-containing protein YvlB